jgi:hypothetical protein
VFRFNGGTSGSGAIYGANEITDCLFVCNGGGQGGTITATGPLTISRSTFVSGLGANGGTIRYQDDVQVDHSIFAFHTTGYFGSIFYPSGGTLTLECTNIYGNTIGDWVGPIADQANINGNFSADPLFCGPGDFTLRANSPCAPPGLTGCGQVGSGGVGCPIRAWHVTADGLGDAPTIQAAIDSSAAADSILVAGGTFVENVITKPSRVLIGSWDGAFQASTVDATPSTIDGSENGSALGADFAGAADSVGIVSGFRFTRGTGTLVIGVPEITGA